MCLAHYVSHYNITKSGSLRFLYVDDAYFTQGKFYVGVAGGYITSKDHYGTHIDDNMSIYKDPNMII